MTTWIEHVKSVYAKGGMSYKEAMKKASTTWKKPKKTKAKAKPGAKKTKPKK